MRRRVLCLTVLLASSLLAQSDNEHGVPASQLQVAYLVKFVELTLPEPPASQGDFAAWTRRAMQLQDEALAKAGGAPLEVTLSGKKTIVAPRTPAPRLTFETWSERLSRDYQESVFTGFNGFEWEGNRVIIQRFIRDNFRRVYIRYSIAAEKTPEGYQLAFGAPGGPAPDDLPTSPGWKIIPPVQFPVPQLLDDGDIFPLELYTDARTGQRLVDYVHMLDQATMRTRKEPARDSYADDAELAVSQPSLKANGSPLPSAADIGAPHGQLLSIYIPGHGSYTVGLKPRPDFELAGEVSGNTLTFFSDRNFFRLDCGARIATAGSAAYNLYIRRDASAPAPRDRAHFSVAPAQP